MAIIAVVTHQTVITPMAISLMAISPAVTNHMGTNPMATNLVATAQDVTTIENIATEEAVPDAIAQRISACVRENADHVIVSKSFLDTVLVRSISGPIPLMLLDGTVYNNICCSPLIVI